MHIEIRKQGKRKLYYLAHSFRDGGKVRKARKYLGANLTEERIEKLREPAEKALREQIKAYSRIRDPLHTVLSPKEQEALKTMISEGKIEIKHLSEEDWKRFIEAFTYDTNAIEGSTVTASEVRGILNKNKWPMKRSKEEISETHGVAEAVEYVRKTRNHISLKLIKKLHGLVFKNSKTFAGEFRGKGIEVVVADRYGNVLHRGAPQKQIPGLLKELVTWYEENINKYHPLVLAAVVHNQFETIHPFQDGNGRVGRLLLNNVLLKHDLPPVNIELEKRSEYYSALRTYQNDSDIRPTIELILTEYKRLKKSLRQV
jgi:fido (protein-threonine AMPylation protein)